MPTRPHGTASHIGVVEDAASTTGGATGFEFCSRRPSFWAIR